jgi:hypothetical protein
MFPKTSPPIKSFIYNNTYNHKSTYFAVAPLNFSLITSTPNTTTTAVITSTNIGNIKIYSAIAVSARVDIVYK